MVISFVCAKKFSLSEDKFTICYFFYYCNESVKIYNILEIDMNVVAVKVYEHHRVLKCKITTFNL